MKGTIFEGILAMYKLRIPCKQSFPYRIFPKVQTLALSFYQHFFTNIIKTNSSNTLLSNFAQTSQTVRQSYTNMFYSLGNISQYTLDFISCLISLLSEIIFTSSVIESDQKIQSLFAKISKEYQHFREYMYILYTQQTIGLKICRKSAIVIFNKFIISQNLATSNFRDKYRINMQLRQFKQNIQQNYDMVIIKPRKRRYKNKTQIYEQVKNIFQQNKMQIQVQIKNRKKFEKLLKKCITEGSLEMQHSQQLTRKQFEGAQFQQVMKTLKNIKDIHKKSSKQSIQKSNKQIERSYENWNSVIHEMRTQQFMSRDQIFKVLKNPISQQSSTLQYSKKQYSKQIIARKETYIPKVSSIGKTSKRKKIQIKLTPMLPLIKLNHQTKMNNQSQSQTTYKFIKSMRSKDIRHELDNFISERKNKILV